MRAAFDKEIFGQRFLAGLTKLMGAEAITKAELKWLSRDVLEATHETGDIGFVNRLIAVLTPMNKKVAILFFKGFTGFHYDETTKMFTKKSKKRYDVAHAEYVTFMQDPNNNIWSWAERHVHVEQKPLSVDHLTKYLTSARQKLQAQGLNDVDLLRAVMKAGVSTDAIIAVMDEMGFDAEVEGEAVSPAIITTEPAPF
jgi:hypothetical protein